MRMTVDDAMQTHVRKYARVTASHSKCVRQHMMGKRWDVDIQWKRKLLTNGAILTGQPYRWASGRWRKRTRLHAAAAAPGVSLQCASPDSQFYGWRHQGARSRHKVCYGLQILRQPARLWLETGRARRWSRPEEQTDAGYASRSA